MTVTDQIKILHRKIKQNEAQYDLGREVAIISARSSKNLDKVEYLIGKDLGLQPSTVEQVKFDISPLGKIFNKGLSEEDKKEELLKILKNIEDKNEVENKEIKEVTDSVDQSLSFEAKELLEEIKTIQKNVNYRKLKVKGGNMKDYRTFKELFRDLCYKNLTIDEAESKQDKFNTVLHVLKNYSPKHDKYVTLKNNLLDNASKFYEGREKIIEGFKNGVFSFYYNRDHEERMKFEEEEEKEKEEEEKTKFNVNKLNEWVNKEETSINTELFKKHFNFQGPSDMLKCLYQANDKEKNNELVNIVDSGLKDFIKENKKISEEERITEKSDKIIKTVKKILKFNKRKQEGQGIKILTPNQMVSRLPISLAQLEAGNSSNKLNNEIRQLLYSLYCSRNMTKQVYNNLIKHVYIIKYGDNFYKY